MQPLANTERETLDQGEQRDTLEYKVKDKHKTKKKDKT
jgi:hypothetical protein